MGNNLYYFLEIINSCFICEDTIAQKKDKANLISEVMTLIDTDTDEELELRNLCEFCDGEQGFVRKKVAEWTDPIFQSRN